MSRARAPESAASEDLKRFRSIRTLHNHWSRAMPLAYYWFLTFENSADLHFLARRFQDPIDFPYYDLTPPRDLHLTLDRVGFHDDVSSDLLADISAAATSACHHMPSFDITTGSLGGTPGAIGFNVSPMDHLESLRDRLRAATLSVYPEAPVRRNTFHAHVSIAYANADRIPAVDVVAAVDNINATARAGVTVTVTDAALVLLEQRSRSYAWQVLSRIPLAS
jgi:2'-5' RNA ligase